MLTIISEVLIHSQQASPTVNTEDVNDQSMLEYLQHFSMENPAKNWNQSKLIYLTFHNTLRNINQNLFGQCRSTIWQQAIALTDVDPNLGHHMKSVAIWRHQITMS